MQQLQYEILSEAWNYAPSLQFPLKDICNPRTKSKPTNSRYNAEKKFLNRRRKVGKNYLISSSQSGFEHTHTHQVATVTRTNNPANTTHHNKITIVFHYKNPDRGTRNSKQDRKKKKQGIKKIQRSKTIPLESRCPKTFLHYRFVA